MSWKNHLFEIIGGFSYEVQLEQYLMPDSRVS